MDNKTHRKKLVNTRMKSRPSVGPREVKKSITRILAGDIS